MLETVSIRCNLALRPIDAQPKAIPFARHITRPVSAVDCGKSVGCVGVRLLLACSARSLRLCADASHRIRRSAAAVPLRFAAAADPPLHSFIRIHTQLASTAPAAHSSSSLSAATRANHSLTHTHTHTMLRGLIVARSGCMALVRPATAVAQRLIAPVAAPARRQYHERVIDHCQCESRTSHTDAGDGAPAWRLGRALFHRRCRPRAGASRILARRMCSHSSANRRHASLT